MGCAISADGSIIVSGSNDNSLKVWDGGTGECLATLDVDGPLNSCALYPDGERIIAVGVLGVYFLGSSGEGRLATLASTCRDG